MLHTRGKKSRGSNGFRHIFSLHSVVFLIFENWDIYYEITSQPFLGYSLFFLLFIPVYQMQRDTCGRYLRRGNCRTCGGRLYPYPPWSAGAKARIHYSHKKTNDESVGYASYYLSSRYWICGVNSFNTKTLFSANQLGIYLDNIRGGCSCSLLSNLYGRVVTVRKALWQKLLPQETGIIVYSAQHVILRGLISIFANKLARRS